MARRPRWSTEPPRATRHAPGEAKQPSLAACHAAHLTTFDCVGRLWLAGVPHKYGDERAGGRQEAGTLDRLAHGTSHMSLG